MRKIFSSFKKAAKWYMNAMVETSAMCPSCMIPANAYLYMDKMNKKETNNKRSKAA